MKLVIVESPTKAKTISKFLGRGYQVESSFGHIRDLPKSKLAIDIEHDFEPSYIIPVKAKKRVTQLKKDALKADIVILASDEDREGEAIAYHLKEALNLKNRPAAEVQRITFHEITQTAIKEALEHPRQINEPLVHAQQARRVLDRLVGYKLSPFLWEKVMKRLSAGRVQSVALRLVCDREAEIAKFIAEEYWTIASLFTKESIEIEASLTSIDKRSLGKFDIPNKEDAVAIKDQLTASVFSINKIEERESRKNPLAPFTTSTLQQEGSKKLRYSAKQTMAIAQGLYEKGLITYMRTDSVNLSKESLDGAKNWIVENLGQQYATDTPRVFKTKSKLAQEAHEAIRPTSASLTPELFVVGEDPKAKKLYELIWRRFMASQLPQAVLRTTSFDIEGVNTAANKTFGLRASGTITVFDGFQKIMPTSSEEKVMPVIKEGEVLQLEKIIPVQHFTEPPARYDEAGLIKILEEYGIGRPSTYAPTISTIQNRNYVEKTDQRRFKPTEIGSAVNEMLVAHFPQIVDVQFTAKMEDEFDEIAEGHKRWQDVIRAFYEPFEKNLEQKMKDVPKIERQLEVSNEVCEKCGKQMLIKYSRFGKFLACSGFPECRNTKKILTEEEKLLGKCPTCKEGDINKRKSKRGRAFYGCSRYPDCDYASWKKPGEKEEEEVAE